MSLVIPSYPTKYSSTPIANAVGWDSFLAVDWAASQGRIVMNINQDAAGAQAGLPPIDQVEIRFGQTFATGQVDANGKPVTVTFPTLAQFVTDNEAAFAQIRSYIYAKLQTLPRFANSTATAG